MEASQVVSSRKRSEEHTSELRGIDAGARTDVYNIIKGLSKKGLAVLLISSDMEEIIELSDRAVTIHQGRLNCEFDRADINQENLTKASFGVIGKEKES